MRRGLKIFFFVNFDRIRILYYPIKEIFNLKSKRIEYIYIHFTIYLFTIVSKFQFDPLLFLRILREIHSTSTMPSGRLVERLSKTNE